MLRTALAQMLMVASFVCVLGTVSLAETKDAPEEDKNAIISGRWREMFVEGLYVSCFENQRASPHNSKFSDDQINKHCNCLANDLADRMTLGDAERFADEVEEFTKLIDAVQAACIRKHPVR
jgi:hypothetical protein